MGYLFRGNEWNSESLSVLWAVWTWTWCTDLLNNLDTACTSDDSNSLSSHLNTILWPSACVATRSFERILSHAEDQITCQGIVGPILSLCSDIPEVQPIILVCLFHDRVKSVRAQIQLILHVHEIAIHLTHVSVKPGAHSVNRQMVCDCPPTCRGTCSSSMFLPGPILHWPPCIAARVHASGWVDGWRRIPCQQWWHHTVLLPSWLNSAWGCGYVKETVFRVGDDRCVVAPLDNVVFYVCLVFHHLRRCSRMLI